MSSETGQILKAYRSRRDQFQRDLGVHESRQSQSRKLTTRLSNLSKQLKVDELVLRLLEAIATQGQDLIRDRIDKPVTTALRTVYQDNLLSFVTEIERTADRMEVNFMFKRGDSKITGPILDSVGGGLIDIASFTLRLCIFRLEGGKGPLVLDEPFRHVDQQALPRAAEFANTVATDMNIQVIAVTHSDVVADLASNTIRLTGLGRVVCKQ